MSPSSLALAPPDSPRAQLLAPGTRLDRFTIVRCLHSGGSADVYEVEHEDLGRRVALKIVRADDDASLGATLARFRREVVASGSSKSRHVAEVYDAGVVEIGAPYLVMELLDGESLDAWIARGPLEPSAVYAIAVQLLGALTDLHERGFVHGDVKPGHVVIHREPDGTRVVKLIDFGLARPSGELRSTDGASSIVGTPAYAAPELLVGAPATSAHDVYSVGVLLYQALTGRLPHEGETRAALLRTFEDDDVVPVRTLRPECPESLAELVMRAIDPHPHERFASAGAFALALAHTPTRASDPDASGVRLKTDICPEVATHSRAWAAFGVAVAAAIALALGAVLVGATP